MLRRRLMCATRPGIVGVVMAFSAFVVINRDVKARDLAEIGAATSLQWCILRSDESSRQPVCYETMIACMAAALVRGSSCAQRPMPIAASSEAVAARAAAPPRRRRIHTAARHHYFTAAERNDLYRAFQEWEGEITPAEPSH